VVSHMAKLLRNIVNFFVKIQLSEIEITAGYRELTTASFP
jgi:hypothetical protein